MLFKSFLSWRGRKREGPARVEDVEEAGGGRAWPVREGPWSSHSVLQGEPRLGPSILSTNTEPRAPIHTPSSSPLTTQMHSSRRRWASTGSFSSFNSEPPAEKLTQDSTPHLHQWKRKQCVPGQVGHSRHLLSRYLTSRGSAAMYSLQGMCSQHVK